MDFALSDEHELIVQTTRDFVRKELLPHEDMVETRGSVPEELAQTIQQRAKDVGLFAFNMPESVGGAGLDHFTQALVERELAHVGWALQVNVIRPSNILMACEGSYQIETYLMPAMRGEKLGCFALTEPGAGSDAGGIRTKAVQDGDDFIVNGSKHFISHAKLADFAVLFAVTGTHDYKGRQRNEVTAFLVDLDADGIEIQPDEGTTSNRGYGSAAIFFNDCRVPARNVIGQVGKGWDVANEFLTAGRVMIAANCVGQARRAMEMATTWAKERVQFGRRIGDNQGVSFKLADMATEIAAAELLTLRTAWKMDQGTMRDADAGMAKLFASEVLGRVTDNTVQIHGGLGLMRGVPVERLWRNARIERIWEGTSEIQRHIIGKAMMNES